ncbi:D-sedoheptulose-7-phosphate isomerase [Nocardiopsis trehalosi]|jgi:D-sedoheptulose 7-phosphate isomerase|uniref:D-sedoheptulose-7-phosphate isomerase n=1 Tax=Nocardiopsis trehalosi TaxID=109329 RepID=UPI00082D9CFE|nr:SIS domain-containing protein [Nocardiopsis trehalosi]
MHPRLRELQRTLEQVDAAHVEQWGRYLGDALAAGRRLFACGNGGSAAEAQHLTAELTGRFQNERRPLSAIALHADTSSVTAIGNDYGYREVFARQLRAHARRGDVLLCLSTSGASENVLAAAMAARELGVVSWALTGPDPSALLAACDDAVRVPSRDSATVQEVHLTLIHLLCQTIDATCGAAAPRQRLRTEEATA